MIKAENLTKVFDQRGIAGIHGLSFSLEQGQILGILGPNGSGKTTLLKILSRLLPVDSGSFHIQGDVHLFSPHEAIESRNVQKFLMQSILLDIDDEKKLQLTRDLADTFEFTFQLRQNLSELSSGQRQKVLLAKVLLNRPSLLLLDEPFTHLDPFTRKDILIGLFKYIRDQNITVVWVTHDLEEAFKFSDQIAVMNFGKFEQITSPIEIVRRPKNLFVAKFVGYRNLFPIKYENNRWTTPFGIKDFSPLEREDAILVVPDYAWEVTEENSLFVIEDVTASKQAIEYKLTMKEKSCFWMSSPQSSLLEVGSQIGLGPVWEQCFHIPL